MLRAANSMADSKHSDQPAPQSCSGLWPSTALRKSAGTRRVVGQHVRQQCSRHPPCFLRRIATAVLQRMREDGDETGIVRRLAREIATPLLADEKDRLRG